MVIFLILILLIIFLFVYAKFFKNIHCDNLMMFTGGVKCGKTSLTLAKAIQKYKSNLFKYRISKIIFFWKKFEKPLFYSNIPLANIDYVPLDTSILERQVRINHKSVCFISEASLVADSMTAIGKKEEVGVLNEEINLFAKLFAHYSHGGSCFIETQNIDDNHYGIKRSINKFIWIERCIKCIPFILVYKVREMAYSEDGTIHNNFNEDIEQTTKYTLVFKSIWKKYDQYCYSWFTDHLDLYGEDNKVHVRQTRFIKQFLKPKKIPSFRKFYTINDSFIKKGVKNEKTK